MWAASAPESNTPQYQYVWSPLAVKTPLVRDAYSGGSIVPDDRLYYLTDANSNVTAVVGLSSGVWQVVEHYVYDPYGNVTVYSSDWSTVIGTSLASSAVGNTLGFASMDLDANTGLYYDEARWYSTAVSTFITTDPARADLNTYRYCVNEPMCGTDPSGLDDLRSSSGDSGSRGNLGPRVYHSGRTLLQTYGGQAKVGILLIRRGKQMM